MDGITISKAASALVAIAAGMVTISKAWELIRKHLHPEADMRPTLDRHGELLDKDNRRLNEVEEQMMEMRKGINVICQTQLAQLNHELTGNNIDRVREARDKLNDYLVNR